MVGKDFRVSLSKNGLQCCTLELDGSCRLQRNWVDPERGACEVKNMGGGQPDSDMKVDFAEIGIGKIGKIGISDFFNLKLPILANFGKIGNKIW